MQAGLLDPIEPLSFDAEAAMSHYDAGRVLVVTLDTPSLREKVAKEMERRLIALADPREGGRFRQAISLGMVHDFTSAAVAAFHRVSSRLDTLGGRLVIFSASAEFDAMVRRCGLHRQIRLAGDVDEAIAVAEGRGRGWWTRRRAA